MTTPSPLDRAEELVHLRLRLWEYSLAWEFHLAQLKDTRNTLRLVRDARQKREVELMEVRPPVTLTNGCPEDSAWWNLTGRIQVLSEYESAGEKSVKAALEQKDMALMRLMQAEAAADEEAGWEVLGWSSTS